jgi:thiol-disulfide isomerase/thioredoxin
MALTSSENIESDFLAPNFELLDTVSGQKKSLTELKGNNGTVIMFICNHCPFVIHINPTIVKVAKEYQAKGIQFIAISSNNIVSHPQDGPEIMKKVANNEGYSFPYLFDETQEVAKAYKATCTPDIYLFNSDLKLYYHGQLDDSRPGNGMICDGYDLTNAMNNLLINKPTEHQKPSIGCSIKWK